MQPTLNANSIKGGKDMYSSSLIDYFIERLYDRFIENEIQQLEMHWEDCRYVLLKASNISITKISDTLREEIEINKDNIYHFLAKYFQLKNKEELINMILTKPVEAYIDTDELYKMLEQYFTKYIKPQIHAKKEQIFYDYILQGLIYNTDILPQLEKESEIYKAIVKKLANTKPVTISGILSIVNNIIKHYNIHKK